MGSFFSSVEEPPPQIVCLVGFTTIDKDIPRCTLVPSDRNDIIQAIIDKWSSGTQQVVIFDDKVDPDSEWSSETMIVKDSTDGEIRIIKAVC